MDTKVCSKCGEEKLLDQFSRSSRIKSGVSYRCKACDKFLSGSWRKNNLEHAKALNRAADKRYNQNNPMASVIKKARKYDLTAERYLEVLSVNNGKCAICNTREATCLDHCHSTGKIRGGLCTNCNTALGKFQDNILWLENAIKYLK